ncbi:hypothetical protein LR48_Vigan03g054300 [Vigna angularis]|uniref:Uncharacterized protein n=1 Tax=Phaseolus angularis TaxID=3914 RepID=A0A0L9U3B8_PHAAN|nr:hypothetical protein LR48_Vigan03g054300 [Vigna angularis]
MDELGNNLVRYWNEAYEEDLLDYENEEEKEPEGDWRGVGGLVTEVSSSFGRLGGVVEGFSGKGVGGRLNRESFKSGEVFLPAVMELGCYFGFVKAVSFLGRGCCVLCCHAFPREMEDGDVDGEGQVARQMEEGEGDVDAEVGTQIEEGDGDAEVGR